MPKSSLREWLKDGSPTGERARALGSLREFAELLEDLAWAAIDVVADKRHLESAYRARLIACQLTDKMLVLRGQPMRIIERRRVGQGAAVPAHYNHRAVCPLDSDRPDAAAAELFRRRPW